MSTIVIKLKKTSYLAVLIVITMTLWQGYGLYQSKIMGIDFNTYFYTKVISNVMPSALVGEQNETSNGLNQLIYFLTDIDTKNYMTIIERNIPSIKHGVFLGYYEDENSLIGFKKAKPNNDSKPNEDYFAQSEELLISDFESAITTDRVATKEQLENDSYVTSKLINFEANLNLDNQGMKYLDMVKLVGKEFRMNTKTGGPKVLIFHTHPTERFAGEEPGGGGIVDVGSHLKKILESQYEVEVLHCTSQFEATSDTAGKDAYGRMETEIKQILKDNPTIEVAIDIHRDSIDGDKKLLTTIDGKPAAKIMFVNGFSKVQKKGVLTPIESLPNPYFEDNIGLSLQVHLKANEKYPGLMRKNLIKPYRYSLHMKPMSLLVEAGNQNNTKEEALNSMDAFAEILMDVIEKD